MPSEQQRKQWSQRMHHAKARTNSRRVLVRAHEALDSVVDKLQVLSKVLIVVRKRNMLFAILFETI